MTRIARPIAASAAATVRTNSAKIWPVKSCRKRRKGHEIDVDRKQDQLDRHQDDDDVLAIEDDAGDAEREQDGRDDQIMIKTDRSWQAPYTPARDGTFLISMAVRRRARVLLGDIWRLTPAL